MSSTRLILCLAIPALLMGCERSQPPTDSQPAARPTSAPAGGAAASESIHAFVSIIPQAYFVERVGGERVSVDVLVGPGRSPGTYAPTPRQMAGLEEADVYFSIGVPFEQRLLEKLTSSLAGLNVVDSRRGVELRMMTTAHHHHGDEAAADHDHAEHASEAAGTPDPHVWMDPKRVKIIARNIHDELVRLDPKHADEYGANLNAFLADLTALDARITETLKPLKGRDFFVFHPAYGYLGDSYGLEQVAVEIEGKEPSPRQVTDLIARARAAGVKVIFVQPQFATSSAEVIAKEIGGVVLPIDPLARDYIDNLDQKARQIAEALGAKQP